LVKAAKQILLVNISQFNQLFYRSRMHYMAHRCGNKKKFQKIYISVSFSEEGKAR